MKRLLLLSIIFLIPLLNIYSQNSELVSAEKAVKMAVENNLQIKKEDYSLSGKKRSSRTRYNAFIPDLTIGSSMSKANEKPEIGEYHWNLSSSFQARLTLSLALFDGIKYISEDYQNGLLKREDAVKQLKRDTLKSFYNLILMRENLVLIEKNIETAEKRYNQADTNFRNGLASELDRLRARVSYEQLKPDQVELANSYKKALLSFKQMIGLEKETEVSLDGEISPEVLSIEINELIFSSLPERLDIQQLISSINLMKIQKQSENHLSKYPSLSLIYNKNMLFADDPFSDPLFENTEDSWSDTGSFTLSLSLDLDSYIPGSKTDTKVKNMQDDIKGMESELSSALQLAEIEIRSIVMELEKSAKKTDVLLLNEKLAERAYELAEEGYNAGTVELLTLESSSDDLEKARLDVLSEKYNYQSALLDLEYAVNRRF